MSYTEEERAIGRRLYDAYMSSSCGHREAFDLIGRVALAIITRPGPTPSSDLSAADDKKSPAVKMMYAHRINELIHYLAAAFNWPDSSEGIVYWQTIAVRLNQKKEALERSAKRDDEAQKMCSMSIGGFDVDATVDGKYVFLGSFRLERNDAIKLSEALRRQADRYQKG